MFVARTQVGYSDLTKKLSVAKDVAIILLFTVHDHSMANRSFFRVDVRDSFFPTYQLEKAKELSTDLTHEDGRDRFT